MVLELGGNQKIAIFILPSNVIQQKENHEIKIEPFIVNHVDVPGEYATVYICKFI